MNFQGRKEHAVRKYHLSTIIAHWLLIISVFALIFTEGVVLINKITDYLNLLELTLPELPHKTSIHIVFGFILLFSILFVIFTRTVDLKAIMDGKFIRNFGGFVRSFLYLVGLEKRLEGGEVTKFYCYQKMTFVFMGFTLWIMIFSGMVLFVNANPDSSINQTFIGSVRTLHIIGSLLIILLIIYHIAILIRRFDGVALKCMFIHGKLPLWYVKKYHKIWYNEIMETEKD